MQRIYLPNTKFSENLIITENDIHHQLTRVLRARVGNRVIFFDGQHGEDIEYEIKSISKKQIEFHLVQKEEKKVENKIELCLYQALPNKFEKIEYIIQKCIEIGYKKIIFFESARSQKLVISEKKKERFYKIAIEATEQCGGNIIPELEFVASFSGKEREFKREFCIMCHTQGENLNKLSDIDIGDVKSMNILVGPEGGFSETEIKEFENIGIQKVCFGDRILRCETVGVVTGFFLLQKKES